MKIHLAKYAGTCYGVERALNLANEQSGQKNVYTLGQLIHNPQVIDSLEKKGVKCIKKLSEISEGKIIIRAHGVTPQEIQEAEKLGLEVIDATCPYVKKVHNIVKKLYLQGYPSIILGEKKHPEVIGIKGYSKNLMVIANLEEAKKLSNYDKLGLVSQTTQSTDKFEKIIQELENHTKELKVYNTICDATIKRQQAAIELSKKVGVMLVLGGYVSGNTQRLAEICGKETETYHIEQFSDLDKRVLEGKEEIGITAGASTPEYIINKLIKELNLIE